MNRQSVTKQWSYLKALPKGIERPKDGDVVIASAEIPPEDEAGGDIVRVKGLEIPDGTPLQAQHLKYASDGSPTTIGKITASYDSEIEWKGKKVPAKLCAFKWADTDLAGKYKSLWPEFINSVSIGAMIKDADPLDPKKPYGGWDIKQSQLYELSIVTIPANPAAKVLKAVKDAFGDSLDIPEDRLRYEDLLPKFEEQFKSILSRLDDIESLVVAQSESAARKTDDREQVQKDDDLLGKLIAALRSA